MRVQFVVLMALVGFSSVHAGLGHQHIYDLMKTGEWNCSVLDSRVIEPSSIDKNLCILHTACVNSFSKAKETFILPCEAQQSQSDECPSLKQCLRNAVEDKKDSTTATSPIFDKSVENVVQTANEGVCSVAASHRAPRGASQIWIEGPKKSDSSKKDWESFCEVLTECADNGIKTSRYTTICRPKKDDQGKLLQQTDEINGKRFKNYICPSFKSCFENQVPLRAPRTKYSTRNTGAGATTSIQTSNHR